MKTQGGMKMAYPAQVLVFRLAGETIRIHKKFVNILKKLYNKLRQQHAGKKKPFFQMQYCFDSSSLLLYWSQYRLWLRTFTFLYALHNGNIYPLLVWHCEPVSFKNSWTRAVTLTCIENTGCYRKEFKSSVWMIFLLFFMIFLSRTEHTLFVPTHALKYQVHTEQ